MKKSASLVPWPVSFSCLDLLHPPTHPPVQCSSLLDLREERGRSIKQRYRERLEHFRLIQVFFLGRLWPENLGVTRCDVCVFWLGGGGGREARLQYFWNVTFVFAQQRARLYFFSNMFSSNFLSFVLQKSWVSQFPIQNNPSKVFVNRLLGDRY